MSGGPSWRGVRCAGTAIVVGLAWGAIVAGAPTWAATVSTSAATASTSAATASTAVGADGWETQARFVMGTLWTIEARGPRVGEAIEGAFREIRRLDESLSTYRPGSELSRANRQAGHAWVPVSAETRELLERSIAYSRESQGAFDPTVGVLVRLWGFKHLDYRKPADQEIARAAQKVGYQHVHLDPRLGVRFSRPGIELDLGAIAKGYAVDRALDHLKRGGAVAARVDAGGNQRVYGESPAGKSWLFGIKHPRLEGELLGVLPLSDEAISTSGDAERGFWVDGVRYGHILDPLAGRPVQGMLSVTVVAPTAEQADALSTALYVLGVDRGRRLLQSHPGCSALFVQAGAAPGEWRLSSTDGFRPDPW